MGNKIIIFSLMLLCSMNLFAQDKQVSISDTAAKPVTDNALAQQSFLKVGSSRVSVYLGNNSAGEEPQFVNIRERYAFGFGVSSNFSRLSNFGFDLDLIEVNRKFDTPIGPLLWGTLDKSTRVQTTSALLGIRAFIPDTGVFKAYAIAGIGYFRTRMVVYGTLFGFPGAHEEQHSSFNLYHGAGFQYDIGRWGLSLNYRRYNLKGSFSSFNISNADLGSDVYLLGWYYKF